MLCRICRRRNLTLAHGFILEAEGTLLCPTCPVDASRGGHGVGGELAALGNDISSLVCIRDLVLMQLRACGRAVLALDENTAKWSCSCRVQSVSKWGRRKRRNGKLLLFPGYKWCMERDKSALLKSCKAVPLKHSVSAPYTPAQHLTWVLPLNLLPLACFHGRGSPFSSFFLFFVWAYFPILSHPKVVVGCFFFLFPCGYSWIKSCRKLITVNKCWLQCQNEEVNCEGNS